MNLLHPQQGSPNPGVEHCISPSAVRETVQAEDASLRHLDNISSLKFGSSTKVPYHRNSIKSQTCFLKCSCINSSQMIYSTVNRKIFKSKSFEGSSFIVKFFNELQANFLLYWHYQTFLKCSACIKIFYSLKLYQRFL